VDKISDNTTANEVRLLRQQAALAAFGGFALRETDLLAILNEAARICAESLEVPFCKICRYRPKENDLLIEAGCGWHPGVIGRVLSQADESSPQGRAYVTGEPVIIRNLQDANNLILPEFYAQHGIVSTIDVLIKGSEDRPAYGVSEIDSPTEHIYNVNDINFLTGFANVLAEAVGTQSRLQTLNSVINEKNMLARELHHRVRNNLQLIQGMLDIYANSLVDGLPKQDIEAIARRVMTLAQVYNHLLGIGLSRTIDFGTYVKSLCSILPDIQVTQNRDVELICEAYSMVLDLDKVTSLGMVIAELITNSYGHGFPDGKSGKIAVSLSELGPPGTATLTVKDNGVGLEGAAERKRHGLGLVRQLMEKVNGSFELQSGEGTTAILTFPIQVSARRHGLRAPPRIETRAS
jgi:two-component sensor histidine kinase